METETMGKVLVSAKIENFDDVKAAKRGLISEDQVPTLEDSGCARRHRGDAASRCPSD